MPHVTVDVFKIDVFKIERSKGQRILINKHSQEGSVNWNKMYVLLRNQMKSMRIKSSFGFLEEAMGNPKKLPGENPLRAELRIKNVTHTWRVGLSEAIMIPVDLERVKALKILKKKQ